MKAPVPGEDWEARFDRWLTPFLDALAYKKRRQWAPVYLRGLLGSGRRKSIEPMAERLAPGEHDQLNHFVNVACWDGRPLERQLVRSADRIVGGPDAYLIVDDTALVKKGRASVGVARQYCGELGKKANCQALVSLTLARRETPVPVALRLYLPEEWAHDAERRRKCRVPEDVVFKTKWQIALEELARVREAGARFGAVLADAGYGAASEFRAGLRAMKLRYAVGIAPQQTVYPADVLVTSAPRKPGARGRPRLHATPSVPAVSADAFVEALGPKAWRRVTWRRGTKGALWARFAAVRVRVADGAKMAHNRHLPGEETEWLICEQRASGERRYYLSNFAASTSRLRLASAIKARWSCEQAHQQMKNELGLDHYEGRSWLGLHHHTLLCMIAMCFLQSLRLEECGSSPDGEKKRSAP
jgi:SRSO17 transposase